MPLRLIISVFLEGVIGALAPKVGLHHRGHDSAFRALRDAGADARGRFLGWLCRWDVAWTCAKAVSVEAGADALVRGCTGARAMRRGRNYRKVVLAAHRLEAALSEGARPCDLLERVVPVGSAQRPSPGTATASGTRRASNVQRSALRARARRPALRKIRVRSQRRLVGARARAAAPRGAPGAPRRAPRRARAPAHAARRRR